MWSIGFPGVAPEQPMTATGLLEKAIELGAQVVQYGPNLSLEVLAKSQLRSLVERAEINGIELELGTRGLEPAHLKQQIALCSSAGSRLLRTTAEAADGAVPRIAGIRERLRAILPGLETAGVRLAIENSRIPAAELAGLLAEFDSSHLGVTLDTVNSLAIPEGTTEVVEALAKHTFCLHAKDFIVQRAWHMMGFTVEGRPAGQGQMQLEWILDQLRHWTPDPNVILELWPPPQKTLSETIALEHRWAEESISYLRKVTLGQEIVRSS